MREKHKLEVTFDIEEAFDFVRFMFKDKPVEFHKNLEQVFSNMQDDANMHFFVSIFASSKNPEISFSSFVSGVVAGVNLALAISRPNENGGEASVRNFLERHTKKGENVVDIMDAFRKQAKQ